MTTILTIQMKSDGRAFWLMHSNGLEITVFYKRSSNTTKIKDFINDPDVFILFKDPTEVHFVGDALEHEMWNELLVVIGEAAPRVETIMWSPGCARGFDEFREVMMKKYIKNQPIGVKATLTKLQVLRNDKAFSLTVDAGTAGPMLDWYQQNLRQILVAMSGLCNVKSLELLNDGPWHRCPMPPAWHDLLSAREMCSSENGKRKLQAGTLCNLRELVITGQLVSSKQFKELCCTLSGSDVNLEFLNLRLTEIQLIALPKTHNQLDAKSKPDHSIRFRPLLDLLKINRQLTSIQIYGWAGGNPRRDGRQSKEELVKALKENDKMQYLYLGHNFGWESHKDLHALFTYYLHLNKYALRGYADQSATEELPIPQFLDRLHKLRVGEPSTYVTDLFFLFQSNPTLLYRCK